MAVVSCKVKRTSGARFDKRNRGFYEAVFEVVADSVMGPRQITNGALVGSVPATDGPGGVGGDPNVGVPLQGSAYNLEAVYGAGEKDDHSYALDYSVEFRQENRKHAYITVNYTPLDPGETPERRQIVVPTNRGASYYWDSEPYQEIVDRDINGVPIVNGAGKTPDRPLTAEKSRPLFVIQFNVANQDTAIALTSKYDDAINSVAWTAFGETTPEQPQPRTVHCKYARSGKTTTENGYTFVPMEFAFAFAPKGKDWKSRTVNEGYGHRVIAEDATYGYAFASADYGSGDANISLTGFQLIKDGGNASPPTPTSVARPADLTGKAGDQISLSYVLSTWGVGDPSIKTDAQGVPLYVRAKELDENGEETVNATAEPVLLYENGARLPEGMVGNELVKQTLSEVDFNDLNSYLVATPPS